MIVVCACHTFYVNALGASHEGGFANPNLTGNENIAPLKFPQPTHWPY
jgi:hypothetical protein